MSSPAGGFLPIIGDPIDPVAVERVLLCSGKVYYDLVAELQRQPTVSGADRNPATRAVLSIPADAAQALAGRLFEGAGRSSGFRKSHRIWVAGASCGRGWKRC
jgi:2-oxoglutarate dehydrogenase complex dehydrogenase (E1) component-like enzyme